MANNQPCVQGSEANCEALVRVITKALGGHFVGTHVGDGRHVSMPGSWNGFGPVPPGWTSRHATTFFSSVSTCQVHIPAAMETELAAAPAQARLTPADRDVLNDSLAAIAVVNLDTYGQKTPGNPSHPIANVSTFMTVWDAWTSNHSVFQADFGGTTNTPHNIYADYPHLKPLLWASGGSFDLWNFPGDTTVDTQAAVDARLLDLDGVTDALSYDWYPPPSCFVGDEANRPLQAYIMTSFECHRASPNKALVKYFVMIDPNWWSHDTMPLNLPGGYGKAADYTAHLAAAMAEPDYFQLLGRPVIGIYNYTSLTAPQRTEWLAQLDDIIAEVGAVWIVIQDNNQTAAADMLSRGVRYKTTYGPNPTLTGSSQNPYSQQVAWDAALWQTPGGGIQLAVSIVALQDRRPKSGGATAYVDRSTLLEFVEHVNAAQGHYQASIGKAELLCISSLSELSESGTFERTTQDGTKYIDAMRIARGTANPSTITESTDAHQLNWTVTGAGWTYVQQIVGAYNSDVMRSSTTNDKRELSVYRCTQIEFLTSKGPDKGIANIYLDGVSQGTVDLYAAVLVHQQLVWSSGPLTAGLHTLGVEVSGTKNAASSAVTIDVDFARSTIALL